MHSYSILCYQFNTFLVSDDGRTLISSLLKAGIRPGKRRAFCSAQFWMNFKMFTIISKVSALCGIFFVFPCVLVTKPFVKKLSLIPFSLCLLMPCKNVKVVLHRWYPLCIKFTVVCCLLVGLCLPQATSLSITVDMTDPNNTMSSCSRVRSEA